MPEQRLVFCFCFFRQSSSADTVYGLHHTAKHNQAGLHSWLLQHGFVFAKYWPAKRINCDSSRLAMHVVHVLRS